MPTLISETDVYLERVDLFQRVGLSRQISNGRIVPPVRTPGLHLSGLLRYCAVKSHITTYIEQVKEESLPLRWAMGQAWEEFAASLYPNMIYQPGEVTEPIIMTCDGIAAEDQVVIMEFKFNRAKKYKGQDLMNKKWLWMQQGLGYCLGYGTEYVEWHVLSAFEFPDPSYCKYLVKFDQKELDAMAKMIAVNKDQAIAEGYAE